MSKEPTDSATPTSLGQSALTTLLAEETSTQPRKAEFAVQEANKALAAMVDYESQYKNGAPDGVRERIFSLADFIDTQLKKIVDV